MSATTTVPAPVPTKKAAARGPGGAEPAVSGRTVSVSGWAVSSWAVSGWAVSG